MPPPLPSRGPGATAGDIFSSDMCHLSCHRGGGGGRRLLTLWALPSLPPPLSARRGPAEPGAGAGHQPQHPPPPPGTGGGAGVGVGVRWGSVGAGGPSAGKVIFSWEWMAIAAAPAPGAAVLRKGTRWERGWGRCSLPSAAWGPLDGRVAAGPAWVAAGAGDK